VTRIWVAPANVHPSKYVIALISVIIIIIIIDSLAGVERILSMMMMSMSEHFLSDDVPFDAMTVRLCACVGEE